MIKFRQISNSSAIVVYNDQPTKYLVSKNGSFYAIYYYDRGAYNPLRGFWSHDKAEIIEDLETLVSTRCEKAAYSNLYYVPI